VIVIGATFATPELASAAEEVEPFKTAITSMFARGWPFVIYAVGLLAFGLFTERAYCRFLCPLGGTLAALDRLHLVDVLKRRPECGSPCRLCENSCPVKAIESSGRIKMAECFQCLDCQVEYYDDHRCPPLVKTRKQLARAQRTKGTPIAVPPLVPVAARGSLA
jgi:polyferredoxin